MAEATVAEARARLAPHVGAAFELLRGDRRWRRWLALADEVVAFAADDAASWRRLESEAWLLERWRAEGVPAPRVLRQDASGRVQLRERLHGLTGDVEPRLWPGDRPDAWARLDGAPLSAFGERLAASYGELAARIRRAVPIADAAAAGFLVGPHWPLDVDAAIARLHASGASATARAAAARLRDWLKALPPPDTVVHNDLHFFNLCLGDDGSIVGVFDVDAAGIDAAAGELRMVHSLGSRFAATALAAYGAIEVADVVRAHLRNALDHVFQYGPESDRHASIVAWATAAFERLAP